MFNGPVTIEKNLTKLASANVGKKTEVLSVDVKRMFDWHGIKAKDLPKLLTHKGAKKGVPYEFPSRTIYQEGTTVICYSGGLESALAGTYYTGSGIHLVNYKGLHEFCSRNKVRLIEPALIFASRLLGANTVVVALDTASAPNVKLNPELDNRFLEQYAKAVDINLGLVFSTNLEKFWLFKSAVDNRMEFCSCDNSAKWCGKCFKCYQIATFYRATGREAPFEKKIRRQEIRKFTKQIQEFKRTKVDKFANDCGSFLDAEDYCEAPIEDIWSNKL